ncbi:extensin family protein [Parablastomonas sp. CN1-191]|uniref:extensin family protein n=1 Tax=Parablastomonas sp. CN1-191 TaxID=3400908 RepID=UPI003BF78FAD
MPGKLLTSLAIVVLLAGCGLLPEARREPARRSTQAMTPRPDAQACLADLGRRQLSFSPLPDQYYGAGCATLNTVRLAALRGDDADFALSNLGPVTCPLAETFAAWARYGVDRAARQVLGSALARIDTMGSYSCRSVAGSKRLSAHATAQAIDVAAFVLADGRRVSVREDWRGGSDAERRFLAVIHASACKRFGTVLGPDYNTAHADHLHLELSGQRFCR